MSRPLVHVEHVMGTVVSFDLRFADESRRAPMRTAVADAVQWLHRVDDVFSTYRHNSQVSRLGRGEIGLADCDDDVAEVLELCAQVGHETDGYFSSNYRGGLDPTGLVKGWAIQRASELLASAGSAHHLVNGGGDVQCAGGRPGTAPGVGPAPPWRVGIADPLRRGRLAIVVEARDCGVATSGTAERGAHIVNPRSGSAAAGLASVTLVGPSLALADACATAAFAMGPDLARDWTESLGGYEAYAITETGETWQTSGFAARIARD